MKTELQNKTTTDAQTHGETQEIARTIAGAVERRDRNHLPAQRLLRRFGRLGRDVMAPSDKHRDHPEFAAVSFETSGAPY
jgi:hypothetical protein